MKAQVAVPVTYADVWEYWLRNREIYDVVDFVTIHILPYWEDFPIRAKYAAAHVDAIRQRMAVTFPGKEILIGETGWPSEGRMREGALPSRTNQARVVSEILALAKQENFRVNLIEAYDQPWKRQLEGTVGGYWGLFDSVQRALKYPPGEAISNFPFWKMADGRRHGAAASSCSSRRWLTTRRRPWTPRLSSWIAVGLSATSAGILLGIAADKMYYESYGIGGWLQWGALLAAGLVVVGASAPMPSISGRSLPTFLDLFGPRGRRARPALSMCCLGAALVVTALIGGETALGFVFDPRYRDFPFASLTMAVVPFACLLLNRPQSGAASDRGSRSLRDCWRSRPSISASTRAATTGSRCGPARSICCWRLRCGWRGACKAQNKQSDRKPRQRDIVEHDAKAGGDQSARQQHDRRPDEVQRGDHKRDDAEHRVLEQHGRQRARLAGHGLQAGVAGERHGRELDHEIAHIKRVADGDEAHHHQPLHLIGRQAERFLFHGRNYAREWRADKPDRRRSAICK